MPTHNIVITDHQAAFIERLVAEGKFESAGEVLFEGLHLVELREADPARKLADLRAAIQQGIDSIERGEYETFESASALADDFRAEAAKIIAEEQNEPNT